MNLESIIQSEVSQKQKNKSCILRYIYMESRKMDWWIYLQGNKGDADIENTLTDMGRGGQQGRGWNKWRKQHGNIYIAICKIDVVIQSPSPVQLFASPWTAAHQASLSFTVSWSLPKFMFIASVMPSSHLILWCPLLPLPSIFAIIRDFSNDGK